MNKELEKELLDCFGMDEDASASNVRVFIDTHFIAKEDLEVAIEELKFENSFAEGMWLIFYKDIKDELL